MAERKRVRHMTDGELTIAEGVEHLLAVRSWALTGTGPDVLHDHAQDDPRRDVRASARRLLRLRREILRRAYAAREHGKTCNCTDCLVLHAEWVAHWRRPSF